MRWYSLFTCLCLWNFYFFLRLGDGAAEDAVAPEDTGERSPSSRRLRRILPYLLTGAALWYTNYIAPVVFFAHLVVALVRGGPRRRIAGELALGWLGIGLLYVPWLPTFFRQLGSSPGHFAPVKAAMAAWVVLAGEFSTPLDPWFAVPVLALGVILAALVLVRLRDCWVPVAVVIVVASAMCLAGVIWTKRVMFLVPLVSMAAAMALAGRGPASRPTAALRAGFVAMVLVISAMSLGRMAGRTEWLTYRWLDPVETAVERVRAGSPDAAILTNSNPVLFYLDDELGKVIQNRDCMPGDGYRPAAMIYPLEDHLMAHYRPLLAGTREAVYVHHSAYDGPVSAVYDDLARQMGRYGFRPTRTEGLLPASPRFLRHHPRFKEGLADPLDQYRVVLVYLSREPEAYAHRPAPGPNGGRRR
jgi:hypothetical protein